MKKYIKIKLVDEKLFICKKNITKQEQIKLQEYIDIKFKNSFSLLLDLLDKTFIVSKKKKKSIKIYYNNFESFEKNITTIENTMYTVKYFPELKKRIN